jgi:ABC-type nitrate/sulfonate/bicarbonate transport system permease component
MFLLGLVTGLILGIPVGLLLSRWPRPSDTPLLNTILAQQLPEWLLVESAG